MSDPYEGEMRSIQNEFAGVAKERRLTGDEAAALAQKLCGERWRYTLEQSVGGGWHLFLLELRVA